MLLRHLSSYNPGECHTSGFGIQSAINIQTGGGGGGEFAKEEIGKLGIMRFDFRYWISQRGDSSKRSSKQDGILVPATKRIFSTPTTSVLNMKDIQKLYCCTFTKSRDRVIGVHVFSLPSNSIAEEDCGEGTEQHPRDTITFKIYRKSCKNANHPRFSELPENFPVTSSTSPILQIFKIFSQLIKTVV